MQPKKYDRDYIAGDIVKVNVTTSNEHLMLLKVARTSKASKVDFVCLETGKRNTCSVGWLLYYTTWVA